MPFFRSIKRFFAGRKAFSPEFESILKRKVRFYANLKNRKKKLLQDRMKIFMAEKIFEGCGGLTLTNEMKVVISAYACLLILEESSNYYTDLRSILVYPDDYVAPVYEMNSNGVVTEGNERRQGESWDSGSVVLSWADIKETTQSNENTHNLVIHEFAHQLDDQYGLSAGIELDGDVSSGDEWTRELAKIYMELREARQWKRDVSPLDMYGATNPAECFAVFLEAFIESPVKLQVRYRKAYRLLSDFLKIDPSRM